MKNTMEAHPIPMLKGWAATGARMMSGAAFVLLAGFPGAGLPADEASTLGPIVVTPGDAFGIQMRIVNGLPCMGCGNDGRDQSPAATISAIDWLVQGFLPAVPAEPDTQEHLVHTVKRQNTGEDRLP